MSYHAPPSATCTCECHGPNIGFYHCFGPPCCSEPDVPRDSATDLLRKDQETRCGKPLCLNRVYKGADGTWSKFCKTHDA